jgi:hypothetical protein
MFIPTMGSIYDQMLALKCKVLRNYHPIVKN